MHWAQPVMPRQQLQLFALRVEEMLGQDDEVRAFDALLESLDFSAWEARFERRRGQPPLHPRVVAGVILYGLLKGLRSSRQLEESTWRRLDVMWLAEGRRIDHATLCEFRKKFGPELEGLFVQVAQRAAAGTPGAGRAGAVDGTAIRANSDRHGARTASSLTRRLGELAETRKQLLEELEQRDCLESAAALLSDGSARTEQLVQQLEELDAQRKKLDKALEVARQRDAQKQAKDGPKATAVRVPVTDPDSAVLPNKEGGFAPNWTATAAVDLASGVIVEARVVDGAEETAALIPAVEALKQLAAGQTVEALLADGNFARGAAVQALEATGVALHSPIDPPVHPGAMREALHEPLPEENLNDLPMETAKGQKRFTRQAFVYVAEEDCYYCPQGRRLERTATEVRQAKNAKTYQRWRYSCANGSLCPLAGRCLSGQTQSRSILRDEYQPSRDQLARRMSTPQAQQLYKKRAPVVEGVFGHIKQAMGFRRFLLRGKAAVQCEWHWVCTAFNLGKILRRRTGAMLYGKSSTAAQPDPNSASGWLKTQWRPWTQLPAIVTQQALAA